MAFPFRKQIGQMLSWLCVSICITAILRDVIYYEKQRPGTPLSELRYRGIPQRHFAMADISGHENTGVGSTYGKHLRSSLINISENVIQENLQINKDTSLLKQRNNLMDKVTSRRRLARKGEISSLENVDSKMLNTDKPSADEIDKLTEILRIKLDRVSDTDTSDTDLREVCNNTEIIGNSCDKRTGCLRLKLPSRLHRRVEQLVAPSHFRVESRYKSAIEEMSAEIPSYTDIIIVSGASSNHYLESQAMLYNLHQNLLPHLRNFTFLYYDLGLNSTQRKHISNICKCKLLDFPFEKFPAYRTKCYTWKPIIVSASIERANLVFWVDASIRFLDDPNLALTLMERARHRGVQMGWSRTTISHTTLPTMFHFFGDEACVYLPFNQGLSGVVVYHNEWLVRRAIIEPWLACALNSTCMCPQDGTDLFAIRISCHQNKGRYFYGVCHRFDQSALSIILSKLYQDKINHIILKNIYDFLDIKRGDITPYPSTEN